MKNEGDYLWDKSGEPDPEVQQLEEILGTLRYQPKPLEIPAGIKVGRERSFFRDFGPRLAIAATIVMLLLGLGLWLGLQRLQRPQPAAVVESAPAPGINGGPSPAAVPSPNDNQNPKLATVHEPEQKRTEAPHRHRVNPSVLAGNSNRSRNEAVKNPQLATNKRDGEAAKDQLMLALRVASVKLSFAQKKMQSTNTRDLIRNQHKIG
jgi:hypothetical protein